MSVLPTFLIDQPERGYRFNVASLVLAAHVAGQGPAGRVLEVGTGVGVISLLLAAAAPVQSLEGIEIQEVMYSYAMKNLAAHQALLRAPVRFVQGDIRAWRDHFAPASFDRVVANPPFYKIDQGHPSPHPVTRLARQEVTLNASELLQAASGLLTEAGVGSFLYPIQRGHEVAGQAEQMGLHARRFAVRSFVDVPPFLAIVEVARRPFCEPLERVRPLTLYDAPHVYQAWLQPWVDRISRPARVGD